MKNFIGWIKRKWYREKLEESTFPNKCSTCAFSIKFDQSEESISNLFNDLQILSKYHLSASFYRTMHIGTKPKKYYGEFCALGLNKKWGPHKKHIRCYARQIKLPSTEINLSDYIAIHQSIISLKLNKLINVIIIILMLFTIGISILQIK